MNETHLMALWNESSVEKKKYDLRDGETFTCYPYVINTIRQTITWCISNGTLRQRKLDTSVYNKLCLLKPVFAIIRAVCMRL